MGKQRLFLYEELMAGKIGAEDYHTACAALKDRLEALNRLMDNGMEIRKERETAFSIKNPWINIFDNLVLPDRLEKGQVKKWIERIEVSSEGRIFLKTAGQVWKKKLQECFTICGLEGYYG